MNKYTNYEIFYLIHKRKKYENQDFNFNGKVDAVSILKFSISDFAFLRKNFINLLGKIIQFPKPSRTPRGPWTTG
jgi:hypothetical protein